MGGQEGHLRRSCSPRTLTPCASPALRSQAGPERPTPDAPQGGPCHSLHPAPWSPRPRGPPELRLHGPGCCPLAFGPGLSRGLAGPPRPEPAARLWWPGAPCLRGRLPRRRWASRCSQTVAKLLAPKAGLPRAQAGRAAQGPRPFLLAPPPLLAEKMRPQCSEGWAVLPECARRRPGSGPGNGAVRPPAQPRLAWDRGVPVQKALEGRCPVGMAGTAQTGRVS